ncbi:MAG: minor capsid protein [Nanoarchaeota archaeon]|nr:minor capsid protein [Nanoarchaeota archaeon]
MVKKNAEQHSGYIAVTNEDKVKVQLAFKGESIDEESIFPKGLGARHPFDFESAEKLGKKSGLVLATVSKLADWIVSDFEVKLKNPNAQTLVNSFLHDTNFRQVMREWVREGLLKGNGFIEIDLIDQKVRILNANSMYVRRNNKGKVLGYTQWVKPFKKFSRAQLNETNTFKPNEIAHLLINKTPNEPYGIGIIYPNERIIENLIQNEQDLQLIISRKAGAPYHIKVGQPGSNTPKAVVDAVKANLQYLRSTVEWVTDGDTDISSIDFKDLGKSLTESQMYFFRQYLTGVEIPEVIMGSGQLNEGIAKVQIATLKIKISSYRGQIAAIAEEKIIRPLLKANNLDEVPDFIWNLPSEEEINERIVKIKELLSLLVISPPMKAALEIELAKLLGFEDIITFLVDPKDAQEQADEKERKEEEEIPQPEVPGVKPNANESLDIKDKKHGKKKPKTKENSGDYTIKEWIDLKELAGFNYADYLIEILKLLKNDPFVDLKAITEADIAKGLLSKEEVEKLRFVLKDGFSNNQTIKEIEDNIINKVKIRDRVTKTGAIINSTSRASNIARTETVRLANQGLLNLYRQNGIERVRFLASISARTCPTCEGLNGQVFTMNDSEGIIPVHDRCRCTWISILE